METFSTLLALCAGNSPAPVNSPHKGQWRGAFIFSWICNWINSWVSNREAGDLRHHHALYDVILMYYLNLHGPVRGNIYNNYQASMVKNILSNLQYTVHQIPKLKSFLSHHHGTGTEIRNQDPSALPWSKMATATTGKDVYTAISTLSHCVSRVWRCV